jgi:uncharacterized protein YqeY
MDTRTALETSLKEALRSGDELRKRTIRQVLAAVKQVEIDRRAAPDEAAVVGIVQKEIKTRRESLDEARGAGRAEMVAELQAEIDVLASFLPQAMSADELRPLAQAAILEAGAASPADMGKVMKLLMPRVAGRAPGDQVSQMVRDLLQNP